MDPITARLERLERDYRRSRLWNRIALLALLVAVCAGFAQQQDPKLPDVIKCKTLEAETVRCTMLVGSTPDKPDVGRFRLACDDKRSTLALVSPDGMRIFAAGTTETGIDWQLANFKDRATAEGLRTISCSLSASSDSARIGFERDGKRLMELHTAATLSFLELRSPSRLMKFTAVANDAGAMFSAKQQAKPEEDVPTEEAKKVGVREVVGTVHARLGSANFLVSRDGQARAVLGSLEGFDQTGREVARHPESTLTLLDKDGKFLEQLPR